MTRQLGLTIYKHDKAYQGYTIFAPQTGTDVFLVDMRGNVVHRWQMPYRPANYGYILDNGNLLYAGRTEKGPVSFGGSGGVVMEADWEGNVLWEYAEDTQHHDFCRMENGNTMVLGWELVPEVLAKSIKGGKPGTEHEQGIWSDFLKEVTPNGHVAWEWHAYRHLDQEEDSICPFESRQEWGHANACEVLQDGSVMISFRQLDTVGIIDKRSGKFSWKWGRGELGHQHDPTQLENGNILIFDNGWHSLQAIGARSRIVEVDPKTNGIKWTYEAKPGWDFFSYFISGAQRLPNGNTLICEGMTGRIFEVTTEGEIVWEYVNPIFGPHERWGWSNTVFRAYRYGPDFPGFRGKELDPERYAWLSHLYK